MPRSPTDMPVARDAVNQNKPLLRDKVKGFGWPAILVVTWYDPWLLIGAEPFYVIICCNLIGYGPYERTSLL